MIQICDSNSCPKKISSSSARSSLWQLLNCAESWADLGGQGKCRLGLSATPPLLPVHQQQGGAPSLCPCKKPRRPVPRCKQKKRTSNPLVRIFCHDAVVRKGKRERHGCFWLCICWLCRLFTPAEMLNFSDVWRLHRWPHDLKVITGGMRNTHPKRKTEKARNGNGTEHGMLALDPITLAPCLKKIICRWTTPLGFVVFGPPELLNLTERRVAIILTHGITSASLASGTGCVSVPLMGANGNRHHGASLLLCQTQCSSDRRVRVITVRKTKTKTIFVVFEWFVSILFERSCVWNPNRVLIPLQFHS